MIIVFQALYALVLLLFLLLSAFIVFHIVKYSYDKKAAFLMAAIFVTFTGLLFFSNLILFANLPLEEMLSYIL
ncbi:MAG: hypothetical protein UX75_C0009G0012 [Candidatus Moranbacteria bacterium GW2011_GWE2_47_10]|nr:MAG: hypothetical protein UX75_C0009G0012 [Candidatus Moranbacteria bacterium GW2011_GWE2_47_10]HBP01562.1 hypothetical protein [Candidatus Moranbacteria bacterium]